MFLIIVFPRKKITNFFTRLARTATCFQDSLLTSTYSAIG